MYVYTETNSAITRHRPILADMPNVATMVKLDVSHSMACDSQPPCWFPFFWRLERALPDQTSEDSNWSLRLSRCLKKWPWIQRTFLQVIEWWHVAAEGASCSWWNRLFFEWFWGHSCCEEYPLLSGPPLLLYVTIFWTCPKTKIRDLGISQDHRPCGSSMAKQVLHFAINCCSHTILRRWNDGWQWLLGI